MQIEIFKGEKRTEKKMPKEIIAETRKWLS
jgi:hypothetical protein